MIKRDLHVHTDFCDGKASPEQTVRAAIKLNMDTLGLVTHSYTFFDESYCIKKERQAEFIAEVNRLKEKYKDRINILCGVEQDYYSDAPTSGFDYVIGSVHYHKKNGEFFPVDYKKDLLISSIERLYGGDFYEFIGEFFSVAKDVVNKTRADIIGHLDIVRKFNGDGSLFDETDPRYKIAVADAVKALIPYGKPFELNTGGIARGYLCTPYPAPETARLIKSLGGKLTLSSDAHDAEHLLFGFREWEKLL